MQRPSGNVPRLTHAPTTRGWRRLSYWWQPSQHCQAATAGNHQPAPLGGRALGGGVCVAAVWVEPF
jgi:hypothetical protein